MKVKDAIYYLKQLDPELEIYHYYDSNIRGSFDGFAHIENHNPNYNQPKECCIPINDEYRHDILDDRSSYDFLDTIFDNK